jgi:hypothetical protein
MFYRRTPVARWAAAFPFNEEGATLKLVAAAALLFGASAWAQDAPPPVAPDTPVEQADTPTETEYGGPAILSRGGAPSIARGGETVSLRPFVRLNGIYDSGLGNTIINPQGNVPYIDGYGVETSFGVTGAHTWKTSVLDLDYRGTLRHYNQNSYYDGMDNSLMLGYTRKLTSHTSFQVSENVARYQRAFSLPLAGYYNTGFEAYDPSFAGLTTNDLFDTPTTALLSTGRLVHQVSSRLSVSATGSGFFIRRRSQALIGTNGYTARGDIAYRLSRYQTISVNYNFSHFDFQNRYGQSDMHGAAIDYSIRIGRYWEMALSGGAMRVESIRNTQVQLDPVVAAILGRTIGFEKFHGIAYLPQVGAHLTRTFRRGSASASYTRTVLAGNGVYTTGSYESGNLGYSYTGFRRLSLQTGASYSRYSALAQALGRYRSYSGGAGFTYRLASALSVIGRIDERRYQVQSSSLNRLYCRALFGFGWAPGDYPLALW